VDETDQKILELLQDDARIPNAEIARQVGMAPSAVLERVRKLEERGLVKDYQARLNPKALGAGLLAFIQVRSEDYTGDSHVSERFCELPEVQEVHDVAGEDCFLLKVRVADTEALGRLVKGINSIPTVRGTRTTIVLETYKESSKLPVRRAK
jgi:Lrp/AsnC family leucine-responsive transcriptional regulator